MKFSGMSGTEHELPVFHVMTVEAAQEGSPLGARTLITSFSYERWYSPERTEFVRERWVKESLDQFRRDDEPNDADL